MISRYGLMRCAMQAKTGIVSKMQQQQQQQYRREKAATTRRCSDLLWQQLKTQQMSPHQQNNHQHTLNPILLNNTRSLPTSNNNREKRANTNNTEDIQFLEQFTLYPYVANKVRQDHDHWQLPSQHAYYTKMRSQAIKQRLYKKATILNKNKNFRCKESITITITGK